MNNTNCPKCGAEIDEETKICPECNEDLEALKNAEATQELGNGDEPGTIESSEVSVVFDSEEASDSEEYTANDPVSPKQTNPLMIAVIVLAIAALAMGAYILYGIFKPTPESKIESVKPAEKVVDVEKFAAKDINGAFVSSDDEVVYEFTAESVELSIPVEQETPATEPEATVPTDPAVDSAADSSAQAEPAVPQTETKKYDGRYKVVYTDSYKADYIAALSYEEYITNNCMEEFRNYQTTTPPEVTSVQEVLAYYDSFITSINQKDAFEAFKAGFVPPEDINTPLEEGVWKFENNEVVLCSENGEENTRLAVTTAGLASQFMAKSSENEYCTEYVYEKEGVKSTFKAYDDGYCIMETITKDSPEPSYVGSTYTIEGSDIIWKSTTYSGVQKNVFTIVDGGIAANLLIKK